MQNHEPTGAPSTWLPVRNFGLALLASAQWTSTAANGLRQRDIGLAEASEGAMTAHHLCASDSAVRLNARTSGENHFQMFYVLKGGMLVHSVQGAPLSLQPGDCIHQPSLDQRCCLELNPHSEVIEIVVPVAPHVAGRPFDLEAANTASKPVVNRDEPQAYKKGDGPRKYFLYRDLGVDAATDGRMHMHIIRATAPSAGGGTGWHHHTMCQLFVVFSGWADLSVEGKESVRMTAGDAMCIAAGTAHNVPAFSEDYSLLEVCIPARYDTVDTPTAI